MALGAFGSHGLKPMLEANQTLETWKTAALYHLLHAVVLLWVAGATPFRKTSFRLLCLGTLIFSGTLYALAVSIYLRPLGAITPFGGLLLIAGWLSFLREPPHAPKN